MISWMFILNTRTALSPRRSSSTLTTNRPFVHSLRNKKLVKVSSFSCFCRTSSASPNALLVYNTSILLIFIAWNIGRQFSCRKAFVVAVVLREKWIPTYIITYFSRSNGSGFWFADIEPTKEPTGYPQRNSYFRWSFPMWRIQLCLYWTSPVHTCHQLYLILELFCWNPITNLSVLLTTPSLVWKLTQTRVRHTLCLPDAFLLRRWT